MSKVTRREMLRAGLAGLGGCIGGKVLAAGHSGSVVPAKGQFSDSFHYDHILGTSLDVWLTAEDKNSVEKAERLALAEIERLRLIFSVHDSDSELSRLNRATGPVRGSQDLLAVLGLYSQWQERTGGICNPQVGELIALWAEAGRTGKAPDRQALAKATRSAAQPGWSVDEARGSVTRRMGCALNLNSLAKGYILQAVADTLRNSNLGLLSGLVNLGGDLNMWGGVDGKSQPWVIGVQDPFHPEDNATQQTYLRLSNRAVATSGGYLRFYSVGGRSLSHIIDPRTGQPSTCAAGATVVAPDSLTANVLATTLCVTTPEEGLRIVEQIPAAECLITGSNGTEFRSPGFELFEQGAGADQRPSEPATSSSSDGENEEKGWPKDYQVKISLELPNPGGRARRPYLAVWIEDAHDKVVRTVVVWGNSPRWLPELSGWWKIGRDNKELVRTTTGATRGPGKYDIVWDGKNDKGTSLPQGTYNVRLEVHREHGNHMYQTGKIPCGDSDSQVVLEKNSEAGATTITYAKKAETPKS